MNAAVTNMAVMFGVMQFAKRIPFDDQPEYITYARIGYLLAQLGCLAVFYFCSIQIKKKNDLTVLKYVNAKTPMVRAFSYISRRSRVSSSRRRTATTILQRSARVCAAFSWVWASSRSCTFTLVTRTRTCVC